MVSTVNPVVKTPEFQSAWNSENITEIQSLLGETPWWNSKSTKKGTLLHAAARQSKHALLAVAIPDLQAYFDRWPHEQVQTGLLETLSRTNSHFEILERWMEMGVPWGKPHGVQCGMLEAMIHVKGPQHRLSLHQLDKVIEYGQRKGVDVWGLASEKDARMALLKHIEPAQMDEALARIPRLESLPKEEVLDILFERNLGSGMKIFTTIDWSTESTTRAQELKNKYAKICLTKMKFASMQVLFDLGAQWPTTLNEDIKEHVLPRLNRKAMEPFHAWVGTHVQEKDFTPKEWIFTLLKSGKTLCAKRFAEEWKVDLREEVNGRPLGLTCSKKKTSWLSSLSEQMSQEMIDDWLTKMKPLDSWWWATEVPQILTCSSQKRLSYLEMMERHGVPMTPTEKWSDGVTSWENNLPSWASDATSKQSLKGSVDRAVEELKAHLERRTLLNRHLEVMAKKSNVDLHVL